MNINGRETFRKENVAGDKSVQHLLGYCLIEKHSGDYFIRISSIEKYLQNKFIYDQSLNDQSDKRARINLRRDNIEAKLRELIWTNTRINYGKKTYDKILTLAIKNTNDSSQEARLRLKNGQAMMEELYLSQLGIIIENQWKHYENIFYDKRKFQAFFDILNESRKVGAHVKPVDADDEVMYHRAFKYFEECLEEC